MMEKVLNDLSKKLGITPNEVFDIYKTHWMFIKEKIEELPLKDHIDDDSFSKLRTNFNIPKLGKINCTLQRYIFIKSIGEKFKNDKH